MNETTTISVIDVATGNTLDKITVEAGGLVTCLATFGSAVTQAVREAYAERGLVLTAAAIVEGLDGYTDGTVRFAADEPVLEAGWVPPVPNVLLDLREAGSDRKLRKYWTKGEGAAKIGWGRPGDFDTCVSHLGKYVTDPKGLCAEYHKAATGEWPGKKAHGG